MNELAKIAYEAARNEILLRIRLREQLLISFLAVVGVLIGVAIGNKIVSEILLIIPFIGLAISFLFSQHAISIAGLAHFCRAELKEEFGNTPQWDNSNTLRSLSNKQLKLRSYALMLVILIPSTFALLMNLPHSYQSSYPFGPLWWFSALCLLVSIIDIIASHNYRTRIYNVDGWQDANISPNKQ